MELNKKNIMEEIIQLKTPKVKKWKFKQPLKVKKLPYQCNIRNAILLSCELSYYNTDRSFDLLDFVSKEVKENKVGIWNLFIDLDDPSELLLKIDDKTKFLVKRMVNGEYKIEVRRNHHFLRTGMSVKVGLRGLFLEKKSQGKGNINIYLDYIMGCEN